MSYYESQETILERMLGRVANMTTIQGSTTYNIQAPISLELENIKLQMDEIINRNNIISAYENGYEDEVVKYCEEIGIYRKQAKQATGIETFYGTPNTVIPSGYKFGNENSGLMYETVLEATINSTGEIDVLAISVNAGLENNAKPDTLTYMPVKMVGVTSCTNKESFVDGTDEEDIDDLFYRYKLKVESNPNGCNKAQYEIWATSVDGIGSVKVYPLKDETLTDKHGHVCIVITDSDRHSATAELCQKVKDYIDPNDGDGSGVAPINAICHVISATELVLNISFTLQLENGYSKDVVVEKIEDTIADYLKKNAFDTTSISITKIGSLIYTVEGVKQYNDLTINGSEDDVTVAENEIAVLGVVSC